MGDPVDLTNGSLSLDPVDVDLGGGLRFARHYASNENVNAPPGQTFRQLGNNWSHSLDWAIKFYAPGASGAGYVNPTYHLKEPLSGPTFFISLNGAPYISGEGGSLTVDASNNVHYTSSSGREAYFDAQNRVTQIINPGELPINVAYGTNTVTYTQGTRSIAITKPSASPGRITSVSANGETWTYTYTSGYLTSVVGPDPSTPSSTDTTTWTYTYSASTSGLLTRVQ